MSASQPNLGRRRYILCELRCALGKARLAQLDIEAVVVALEHNIITPEQAVALFWDSEAIQFLGLGFHHVGEDEEGVSLQEVSA